VRYCNNSTLASCDGGIDGPFPSEYATRALLRARNRRRRMAEAGYSEVAKEELPTFLDDLVDAQHGLWMLLVACGESQRKKLRSAAEKFDKLVDKMLSKKERPPESVWASWRMT
jgi:hypothetical protein